jgi:DNA-binding CsgD family transcriptional regulator
MKKNALPRVIMIVTALIACVTILLVLFLTVNNIFLLAVAMMAFWSLFLLVLTHSCSKGAGNTRRNLFLQYFWMGSYLLVFTLGKASFWFAFIDDTVALVLAAVMLVGAALLTSFSREPNEYPQVGNTLLPTLSGDFSSRIEYIATRNAITDREKDVLCLLAKGYSLKKIASQLMISQSTAKTHRHSIYLKLSVSSRQELIDFVETES